MGQMHFPKLTLRQAGERLKRIVAGNPGTKDHLRVAEACITANTLDEALASVAAATEFQVDVDDAAGFIRKAMNGDLPMSDAEVEALLSIGRTWSLHLVAIFRTEDGQDVEERERDVDVTDDMNQYAADGFPEHEAREFISERVGEKTGWMTDARFIEWRTVSLEVTK